MRRMLIALGLLAIAGINGRWACGEEAAPLPAPAVAAPAAPTSVRLDVQMVSVSMAEARNLVPALENGKTADAAWTRLEAMIARGEAKLLAWPVLWLQNGVRGTAESVQEVRYATEFDPPQFPNIFGRGPLIFPNWGPRSPTAFETRDVGSTFEATPTVEQDGQVVALDCVSQFVRLTGFREWHTQRSPLGIAGVYQQPYFQTSRTTAQLRVHRDQPALFGVFVFSEPEPHVELHILHARATMLPPSVAIPPTK